MSHLRRWVGAVVALGVLGVACAACSSSDSGRHLSAPDGATPSSDSGTGSGSGAGDGGAGAPAFHVAQAVGGTLVVRDRPESDGAVVRTLLATDNVSGKIVCLVADQLGDWV